jgi:hypothetical protein
MVRSGSPFIIALAMLAVRSVVSWRKINTHTLPISRILIPDRTSVDTGQEVKSIVEIQIKAPGPTTVHSELRSGRRLISTSVPACAFRIWRLGVIGSSGLHNSITVSLGKCGGRGGGLETNKNGSKKIPLLHLEA